MEQLASLNEENLRVIGVGTLDDRAAADNFQSASGVETAELVWTEDSRVWSDLDVGSQHTTILFDSSGNEIQRWSDFSAADVAAALN